MDSYRRPSGLLAMTRAGRVDPMGMHELQTENISVCTTQSPRVRFKDSANVLVTNTTVFSRAS